MVDLGRVAGRQKQELLSRFVEREGAVFVHSAGDDFSRTLFQVVQEEMGDRGAVFLLIGLDYRGEGVAVLAEPVRRGIAEGIFFGGLERSKDQELLGLAFFGGVGGQGYGIRMCEPSSERSAVCLREIMSQLKERL